jgi:guanylate kinase
MTQAHGTLFTISAPSGAGKTSLVQALLARSQDLQVSVSHTTRPMRDGEQHGVNYHFIAAQDFQTILQRGGFLEHAQVFDNWYGTSRQWVDDTLANGSDVILEIDWQGASQIRQLVPGTVAIFILPPSRDALLTRLTGRGQDAQDIIERRMHQATDEMSHYANADYLVINDDFDEALQQLATIIDAQRLGLAKQCQRHDKLIEELLSERPNY